MRAALDPDGAPRCTGLTFTFEWKKGTVMREDGRGCPLWYLGTDDYRKAHADADTNWSMR